MTRHYLDHASTSPLRPEAADAMRAFLDPGSGADPARLHAEGRAVRVAIEEAREKVAALFGAQSRNVIFTSGATEAVNTASWSASRAVPGGVCLVAGVEHSCVADSSRLLGEVVPVAVDGYGVASAHAFADALERAGGADRVALVHCQVANHEVGTVQPVGEVADFCHEKGLLLHSDAAAASGHIPVSLGDTGADMLSVSAHKMGGPPGVGALILRRGVRISPLIVGGAQERARRGGLENVPGIVGFGAVAETVARCLTEEADRAAAQVARLVDGALRIDGVRTFGHPDNRVPHIACLGIDGVEAEPVLLGLDQAGIAVHSGSACSSEALEPSPVLAAMGVDAERSLRVSVGWSTGNGDVDAFVAAFGEVVGKLRALRSGG